MPGRSFNSGNYRYCFNGMEKDDEVKGIGNSIEFRERIYDSRLGKFLSIDALSKELPWNSSYAFAENRTIEGIDFEGNEYTPYIEKYQYKSVSSGWDVLSNFNGFLKNVGADIYNSSSSICNAVSSTAVNTYNNGASNTVHKIGGKAQQVYSNVKTTVVAGVNDIASKSLKQNLKDAGSSFLNPANYELPAELALGGMVSKLKVPYLAAAEMGITFESAEILAKYETHIFSKNHINEGILDLGKTRKSILSNIESTVNKNLSKLKEGDNFIYQKMNGQDATVKAFVKDGKVISIDAFKGKAQIRDVTKVNVIK
jgi:RHS repeat-associated protein